MAISGNDRALMFALSGVMRSGASRSNYTGTGVFIAIGGVEYGDNRANRDHRVLRESLTIVDALNDEPNTCSMTTKGFVPPLGAEVIIRLGSTHNARREFAGRISQTTQGYLVDAIAHDVYAVAAIDYTWGLNQRKVTARYTGTATAIAQQLLAQWAPGYSSAAVQANLPVVDDGITFTHQDLTDCLTQLAKRVGASWFIDYQKVLHLFLVDTSATDPQPLTLAHPTARDLNIQRDASQWVSRAIVEGGGVAALTDVAIGETLLPVQTTGWYPPGGGLVSAGPQHVRYGGVLVGGTGALVGTGAQPSVPVTAAAAATAGALEVGVHGYAYTYETAGGESLPGPTTPTDATLPPPPTAPAVSTPGVGAGPNPGTHEYAVAFRTAAGGETLVGPRVSVTTGLSAPPAAPPTPTASAGAGLPQPSAFDYAVTFRTAVGETTPGPVSGAVLTSGQIANAPAPGLAGTGPNSTQGDLIPGNYYGYAVSWSTAAGQTTHSAQTGLQYTLQARAEASTANAAKSSHILVDVPYGPAGVTWVHLYRVNQTVKPGNNPPDFRLLASFANAATTGATRFTDTVADSAIAGALAGVATNTTPVVAQVTLTNLPKGGSSSGVIARRIYRRQSGGTFGLVADVADNVTTSIVDALATPGAAPPAVSTAVATQIALSNLPIGGPLVTDRALYRTAANAPALQLLTYFGDNVTTTFLDQYTDASLGGPPPSVATARGSAVQVGSIAVGPTASGNLVIARRLYRTVANGAALKLLVRIADNVTTTYLDTAADAALGAAPPTFDLSGLKQPEGSVNAGATVLPVSGAGWAPPAGGWVIIGNGQQVVRYASVSGNNLVGIPASGAGAITATITYNSSITVAPMLTGIPASGAEAIRVAIVKGDDVNVLAILDDAASQAALAALIGGDGVQEEFLQDRRLSYGEAVARAEALLALRGRLFVAVHFTCRDRNAHAGRLLHVDLGPPFNLQIDLRVQRSTATYALPSQPPLYAVEASSTRFSFEDLLRMARLTRGT
jgi:hypothetical protein